MNLICIIDIWKILILTWKILILESFLNSGVIFNDSWFWFGIPESILGQVYEILLSCEPLGKKNRIIFWIDGIELPIR